MSYRPAADGVRPPDPCVNERLIDHTPSSDRTAVYTPASNSTEESVIDLTSEGGIIVSQRPGRHGSATPASESPEDGFIGRNDCSICTNSLQNASAAVPCPGVPPPSSDTSSSRVFHQMCKNCFDKWVKLQINTRQYPCCPTCRLPLSGSAVRESAQRQGLMEIPPQPRLPHPPARNREQSNTSDEDLLNYDVRRAVQRWGEGRQQGMSTYHSKSPSNSV